MSNLEETLEVERAVNLLAAFGWKHTTEERKDDEIVITFSKPFREEVTITPEDIGVLTP